MYNPVSGGDVRVRKGGDPSVTIPGVLVGRRDGLDLVPAEPAAKGKIEASSFKSLGEAVDGLLDDGALPERQAGLLRNKVTDAGAAVEIGDFDTAVDLLVEFQDEVFDLLFAGALSGDQPDGLLRASRFLISRLLPLTSTLTSVLRRL